MLTIIGTLLGLLGSLLPEVLKFFNNKEDHKHEVDMAKLQMEAAKQAGEIKLEEINATADIEEAKAIYANAEQKITGVRWIDGAIALYSSSVRPTITYAFFALYGFVKFSMVYSAISMGTPWQTVGLMIWTSEDFAVFSTIMAFWFGGRFLKSALARSNGNGNGKK
jgi:hypothetical protein